MKWNLTRGHAVLSGAAVRNGDNRLEVEVNTRIHPSTRLPMPEIEIRNAGTESIPLADVTVRYYFASEGSEDMTIGFWTTASKEHVQARFVTMPVPLAMADSYVEVGFAPEAGMLQPKLKVGVYIWVNKGDLTGFRRSDDAVAERTGAAIFGDSDPHAAAAAASGSSNPPGFASGYISGRLVWGSEPGPMDTPTAYMTAPGKAGCKLA